MIKLSIISLLFLITGLVESVAQKYPSSKPRLVVFILIDELSTDQLVAFSDKFSNNGINRLINGGTFYRNATLPAGSLYSGSNLSTVYTGAYASTHGIISDWWYDYVRNKEVSAAYGDLFVHKEDGRYPSAERLLVSTFPDELKWMYDGVSKVSSIGFNNSIMVWTGGHAPNSLFNINTNTGHFDMAQYGGAEMEVPEWVEHFNNKNLPDTYSNREWGPLKDLYSYHQMKYHSYQRTEDNSFMYSLSKTEGNGAYIPVAYSPYGNKLVRDFAVAQIINEEYGKDDVTDVITIQFTSRSVHGDVNWAFDAETEDMLLRLDLEIAALLKTIDKEVGLDNTLVVTTSFDTPFRSVEDNNQNGIPSGFYSGYRASSLLNLYLMAIYGQGKWVMAYNDGQMYLNHKLIEEKELDLSKIKKQSARFLTDMEGVAWALPVSELMISSADITSLQSLKHNLHPLRSGDILIKIQPGWSEELEDGTMASRKWNKLRLPLIFYGWKVGHKNIYRSVPMVDIAPTISSFLEIPFPNGCEGSPLPDMIGH